MHERESQNAIVSRSVKDAARALPTIERTREGAVKVAPVAPVQTNVLRAGVQPIGEAVLGR